MISNRIKRLAIWPSIVALILGVVLATAAWAGGRVMHRVSVGGPDGCEAFSLPVGCNANFSLHAIQFSDGTAHGQYTDQFGHGNGGFHAVIDCVAVSGNQAWVSGWVTQSTALGISVGDPVVTSVIDNGKNKNPPLDQIHFSRVGDPTTCTAMVPYFMFDMPRGQVTVK